MQTNRVATHYHLASCVCYACDAQAVGVRDNTSTDGIVEPACARHAEHLDVREICIYCDVATRRGSLSIDGQGMHASCHAKASL